MCSGGCSEGVFGTRAPGHRNPRNCATYRRLEGVRNPCLVADREKGLFPALLLGIVWVWPGVRNPFREFSPPLRGSSLPPIRAPSPEPGKSPYALWALWALWTRGRDGRDGQGWQGVPWNRKLGVGVREWLLWTMGGNFDALTGRLSHLARVAGTRLPPKRGVQGANPEPLNSPVGGVRASP